MCRRVYLVKVNELVICYLDSDVASDEIQETFYVFYLVVEVPPVLLELIVPKLLEEQDAAWASDAKSFIEENFHLTKV